MQEYATTNVSICLDGFGKTMYFLGSKALGDAYHMRVLQDQPG
jgi:hypothetical protein